MAKVVTRAVKQASLNLKDMIDKKPLGLEIEDLTSDEKLSTTGELNLNGSRHWGKNIIKPDIIETAIEQIQSLFNVGKEVIGWSATYYPASSTTTKGSSLQIPPGEKSLGCRYIIVIGTREVANLSVSVGSTDAENSLMMLSGDCLNLKITICPVLNIIFNNINSEKMAPRKGFREMMVKKNFQNRHVLVLDGHVEMGDVISHVSKNILGKKSETTTSDVEAVVEAAKSS